MVMDGEAVAANGLKIIVDPISMIKTLRVQQWWLYKSTHCFNGGKGIPGYDLGTTPDFQ